VASRDPADGDIVAIGVRGGAVYRGVAVPHDASVLGDLAPRPEQRDLDRPRGGDGRPTFIANPVGASRVPSSVHVSAILPQEPS
jgi:hypothetical protein